MEKINNFITKISLTLAIIFMIIFAGCSQNTSQNEEVVACTMDAKMCSDGSYVGRTGKNCEFVCPTQNQSLSTGELKKFSSSTELEDYLKKNSQNKDSFSYSEGLGSNLKTMSARVESAVSMDSSSGSGTSNNEYSTTNNQVSGVDEADIVKTDGEYIYGITGNKLYIMKAFPSSDAKIIYETKIEGYYGQEIFVSGDKLILLTTSQQPFQTISKYDFMPRESSKDITKIIVYSISNKEKPQVIETYEISGSYYDSRLIGSQVYVISNEYIYNGDNIPMPFIKTANTKIMPEVYYFDSYENSYIFNTIASIDLENLQKGVNAKSFMLASANTLYVSHENIYVAYENFNRYFRGWGYDFEVEEKNKFFEVVVPLLPSQTKEKIEKLGKDAPWNEISSLLEDMYNEMDENDKKSLIKKIETGVEEYDVKQEEKRSKTIIHKIAIKDGEINYVAKAEVKGSLLNQFSLDEFNSTLRVATTYNIWTEKGSVIYNNVYVLGDDMIQVGALEKIAPEEKIYSTRFMQDKLYMVTFKQVDPLFVIDLSNKQDPKILGYLKIPGFSDYLQMYDETHLIGIGKDTYTEKEITRTKGIKISMFDVSDFENPKEVDSVIIGDEGSYSAAQNEHKSLLLDKRKNLLVLPVTEVTNSYEKDKYGYYRNNYWQGAYVFSISENGFKEVGKVSHESEESRDKSVDNYYYADYNTNILRSIFIGEDLYTISNKLIKINDLDSLKEIDAIKLPYEEPVYDYPIVYSKGNTEVSEAPISIE